MPCFFGPLAAILIGVEAGAGDASAGVFRDLVVTGRSRLALFASRVPAALAMCWLVILARLRAAACSAASCLPRTSPPQAGSLILNGLGFALLETGVLCVIAVGFASLTTSKPGAITALIAWQIVASPLLANISSLGGARKGILSQAIVALQPRQASKAGTARRHNVAVALALLVLVVWLAVFLALGAWRTCTMDA